MKVEFDEFDLGEPFQRTYSIKHLERATWSRCVQFGVMYGDATTNNNPLIHPYVAIEKTIDPTLIPTEVFEKWIPQPVGKLEVFVRGTDGAILVHCEGDVARLWWDRVEDEGYFGICPWGGTVYRDKLGADALAKFELRYTPSPNQGEEWRGLRLRGAAQAGGKLD